MNGQFAQRHRDQVLLMQLTEVGVPTSYDKVQLAALMMRYTGQDIMKDIEIVIRCWKLTPHQLLLQAKDIWANGFRPEDLKENGSQWDAKPGE